MRQRKKQSLKKTVENEIHTEHRKEDLYEDEKDWWQKAEHAEDLEGSVEGEY